MFAVELEEHAYKFVELQLNQVLQVFLLERGSQTELVVETVVEDDCGVRGLGGNVGAHLVVHVDEALPELTGQHTLGVGLGGFGAEDLLDGLKFFDDTEVEVFLVAEWKQEDVLESHARIELRLDVVEVHAAVEVAACHNGQVIHHKRVHLLLHEVGFFPNHQLELILQFFFVFGELKETQVLSDLPEILVFDVGFVIDILVKQT